MFLRKKWIAMLTIITAVLVLGACGGKETTSEVSEQDGSQDPSPVDFMPISEGFENYKVWINTDITPQRNTYVNRVYVFENGKVTSYSNWQDDTNIEDIINLSDDEIIELVKKGHPTINEGNYTLDITLDELGQNTKELDVILEEGSTNESTFILEELAYEEGFSNNNEYISSLEQQGRVFKVDGEYITFTEVSEEPSTSLTLNTSMVSEKIFDTTYSGVGRGDSDSLLTRVDDSFAGFTLDSPDTKSKNVTIEAE